jgi:hypothetical protein
MNKDYEYDVFYSYKRYPGWQEWHRGVVKKLQHSTEQELGKPIRIFFDEAALDEGSILRPELTQALQTSRCLVASLDALYFRSRWCTGE